MKALVAEPLNYEFCFPDLGAQLKVEVKGETVTIRATRNTFSRARKAAFIRELAAEGFIPGEYRWLALSERGHSGHGVRWIVDPNWLEQDALALRTRSAVLRLVPAVALIVSIFVGFASATPVRAGRPHELIGPRGQHYVNSPGLSAH